MSPDRDEVAVVIASPGDDIGDVIHSPNKRRKLRNKPTKRRTPVPKKAEPKPKKRKITPSRRSPVVAPPTPGSPVQEQTSSPARAVPQVAAPTHGTPKKSSDLAFVPPAMGKVDSAFAATSFSFSRANQRRMRERALHMKSVSEGTTTIEKIPEEYRADVQEEIRNEQRRLAQNYHANTIMAMVVRCETKLQYYTRKKMLHLYKQSSGPEQRYVEVRIVSMVECVKAVNIGPSDCTVISESIGPNVVRGVQLPLMDLVSSRGDRIVVEPTTDNLQGVAKRSRLLPGVHFSFTIPVANMTARKYDYVELSQVYCSMCKNKARDGSPIFTRKAQICTPLMKLDLGKSYNVVLAQQLKNLCMIYDFQLLNPPSKPTMEPLLDRDGDPKFGEDGQQLMRTVRDDRDYAVHGFMTENFRELMMPNEGFPMHVHSMSIRRAINQKESDPMMMLQFNVETIEAQDYRMQKFRKVCIDLLAFGCRPSKRVEDQSLLLAHFGLTDPKEFNVLLTNAVMSASKRQSMIDEAYDEEEEEGEDARMDTSNDVEDVFDAYPPMVIFATHHLKKAPIIHDDVGGWVEKEEGDTFMDIVEKLSRPSHSMTMVAEGMKSVMSAHLHDRHHGIPLTPEQALATLMRHRLGKSPGVVKKTVTQEINKMKRGVSLTIPREVDSPNYVPCYTDTKIDMRYGKDFFNLSDSGSTLNQFFKHASEAVPRPDGPPRPVAQFYLWTASTGFSTEEIHYRLRKDKKWKKIRSTSEVDEKVLMSYLMSETGSCRAMPIGSSDVCARKVFIVYT